MMYGSGETLPERVEHLLKLRDLQDETGGFTAFICWEFQHEQARACPAATAARTPICARRRSRAWCSTTFRTCRRRG